MDRNGKKIEWWKSEKTSDRMKLKKNCENEM